jgi:ubiquinone/menaquinone biosynthesis C-methylase UbiE
MQSQEDFFGFAAEVGLTKHIGGLDATDRLIELCHIGKDSYVLDVGCGVGATAVYLAKKVGCRVAGADILEGMVKRSRERAKRERVSELVEFRVADAVDLPFEDGLFDAVITESVTVFPEDKLKAVSEYVRVTKPGGYIGLNESTWLRVPPPPEIEAWVSQDLGPHVKPLTSSGWVGLLEANRLENINSHNYKINMKVEAKGIYRRYGFMGMMRILIRMSSLYRKNESYRKFVKRVRKEGITPENLNDYFGYGIYVGHKLPGNPAGRN